VPGKNVRELRGHPLIAYTIAAALDSGVFEAVVVSTDSEKIAAVARGYGAEAPWLRPAELAGPRSPDIDWVRHALDGLPECDAFAILRPTSPFRTAGTIRRAWDRFTGLDVDSLRAVRLCREHPGKMWVVTSDVTMAPLLDEPAGTPLHSRQYADLPPVHVQDSSLEIAWTRVALEGGTIAGERVAPFFPEGEEGFSIDYPEDFERAERMAELLPELTASS